MNKRLNRVLDEIQKTENKIAEWQAHLRELNEQKKQMEDAEIIKSIRSMKLQGRELLELLTGLQEGTMSFQHRDSDSDSDAEMPTMAEHKQVPEDGASESEGMESEKKD